MVVENEREAQGSGASCTTSQLHPRGTLPTLLDERVGRQLPGAHVGVLLVGVLPVVVPLQRAGYVTGVVAVGTAERL